MAQSQPHNRWPPVMGPAYGHTRSKSAILPPPVPTTSRSAHTRGNSLAEVGDSSLKRIDSRHHTRNSRTSTSISSTFAPRFIKSEASFTNNDEEKVSGIEGENDFSGKRYVWVKDPVTAFVRGWVVEELDDSMLRIQCDDGSVHKVPDIPFLHRC